jgi:molecular chaperone HscB
MSEDYFTLLKLPRGFEIDDNLLEQNYFALQRETHPDRVKAKPAAEKQAAASLSVQANDAYRTLREPLSRARYLLSLEGIKVGTDNDTVKPENRILTESLTWRELLAEGQNIAPQMEAMRRQCLADVAAAFTSRDLAQAAQHVFRLIYIEKALEESQKRPVTV